MTEKARCPSYLPASIVNSAEFEAFVKLSLDFDDPAIPSETPASPSLLADAVGLWIIVGFAAIAGLGALAS